MKAETFERVLHMWPQWHDSIEKSRQALGYDPQWPVERAVEWIEANYADRVRPLGQAELQRLELPPNLQQYWEDCFYSDYRRPDESIDFSRIRRAVARKELDRHGRGTGRWVAGNRSWPTLPYEVSIVHYPEEDIQSPWVRLEIMIFPPLASHDLLQSAAEDAWTTLKYGITRRVHPIAKFISKAKANSSESKRLALERLRQGEIDFEGLLVEEWQKPDIQAEARLIVTKYRTNPKELRKRHRWLQKKVYDRVWRWCPDPKPKAKARGQWRRRLLLPS